MYYGTIIENSLADKSILQRLVVNKTWSAGTWTLHQITASKDTIPELQHALADGPWYIHLWQDDKENITVIFKEKIFSIQKSDQNSWKQAIDYGVSIGIPKEQLDFIVN